MAPDPHTDSFPSLKRAYLPIAAIKKKKQTNNQSNNKDTKNDENKKQRKTLKIRIWILFEILWTQIEVFFHHLPF